MSKDHIEKGMFLRGGDYPARYSRYRKGMFLRGGDYPHPCPSVPDEPRP